MKVLLVDNKTIHLNSLLALLAGHAISTVSPEDIPEVSVEDYDAIILSGSSTNSVVSNERLYRAEKDLILHTARPVIGICLGFELIARAYGAIIKRNNLKIRGWQKIQVVKEDEVFKGKKDLEVYESHRWVVSELPMTLLGLAKSETGWEILRHTEKRIYAMQFHPEVITDRTQDGMYLFHTIFHKITNR